MIEAVIFDMDGVLIDAKDWHYEALNRALRLFGYEISRYEHLVTYDGLPTRLKLEMLSVERGLPMELHEFINEMKQLYTMEMVHTKCKPKFVHEYALSKLKNNGYKLGVASNSIRETVEIMIDKASLAEYMDVMLSCSDVAMPKPEPDVYIAAMGRLDIEPNKCLIVEDNENGIKAANASGAYVMVVKDVGEVNYDNIMQHIHKFNL